MTLNKKLASMIAVLWTGLILIGGFGAWQNRASMISDRRDQLASLIDQANHIVNRYYTLAQQHTITEDEAKKQALETLAAMRYGKDGYISVNNSQSVMLMHPFKPELVGKNLTQFTDPAGNHLFTDIVEAGNHDGGGYVDYLWSKPGSDKPVAKTSFSLRFAPWDWYLVTGMYMDDVQNAFYANLLRWLVITVTLGAIATAVMLLVLRSIRRTLGATWKSRSKRLNSWRAATSPRACRYTRTTPTVCCTRSTPCRPVSSIRCRACVWAPKTSTSAQPKSPPATRICRNAPRSKPRRSSKRRRAWIR